MAKKTYVGVNNIARNVSKMYVGVNGVARKVKKAYVGVGGVARLFYRKIATSVTKISSGLDFSYGMSEAGTAQNENYVLFNGDKRLVGGPTERVLIVNAFDKTLTRTIPSDLYVSDGSGNNEGCSGARVGNYAIMGKSNTINRYDAALTRGTVSINIGDSWGCTPKASINGYAILGRFSISNSNSWSFFAINENLTVQYVSSLSSDLVFDTESASAFENKMYIFSGGKDTNYRSIDNTLTLTNEGSYSTFTSAKSRMMTGTTSKYCFCVGGLTSENDYTTSTYQGFAVDDVGTKASASLGSGNQVSSGGGVASKDLFLVGGGVSGTPLLSYMSKKIYQFDNSLTKTVISDLDYKVLWNYGNAYWNEYFIFHNARALVGSADSNVAKANLYQEQF